MWLKVSGESMGGREEDGGRRGRQRKRGRTRERKIGREGEENWRRVEGMRERAKHKCAFAPSVQSQRPTRGRRRLIGDGGWSLSSNATETRWRGRSCPSAFQRSRSSQRRAVHRLGEGGFQRTLISDSVLSAVFVKRATVDQLHGRSRDENRYIHWASRWSRFFRSEKILSASWRAVGASK